MTKAVDLAANGSILTTPVGTAPGYLCRAWVNFNGTGTVAIRASGNVSSITDNGVGNYTVNFTTAMPDSSYAALSSVGIQATNPFGIKSAIKGLTLSSCGITTANSVEAAADYDTVVLTITR